MFSFLSIYAKKSNYLITTVVLSKMYICVSVFVFTFYLVYYQQETYSTIQKNWYLQPVLNKKKHILLISSVVLSLRGPLNLGGAIQKSKKYHRNISPGVVECIPPIVLIMTFAQMQYISLGGSTQADSSGSGAVFQDG